MLNMDRLFVVCISCLLAFILLMILLENSSESTFFEDNQSISDDSSSTTTEYRELIITEEVWIDDVKVRNVRTVEWVKE